MSNHFAHGYALLIGVGRTVESRFSLPVTVKDVQALKAVLIDPHLCAYLDDVEHTADCRMSRRRVAQFWLD